MYSFRVNIIINNTFTCGHIIFCTLQSCMHIPSARTIYGKLIGHYCHLQLSDLLQGLKSSVKLYLFFVPVNKIVFSCRSSLVTVSTHQEITDLHHYNSSKGCVNIIPYFTSGKLQKCFIYLSFAQLLLLDR